MMTTADLSKLILSEFPYSPTPGQQELITVISGFILSGQSQFPLFVLEGFAGTGKTTLVSSLVNVLPKVGYHAILLAPTGRAAKVFSSYARMPASTIHKCLYRPRMDGSGTVTFALLPNRMENALFIIDEASMIPDDRQNGNGSLFQQRNLLEDLIMHVFSGKNCKMLFMGDTCQLPPVGIDMSPALDKQLLRESYFLDVADFRLTDVVRQSLESGILRTATRIRAQIDNQEFVLPFFDKENSSDDVISINGTDFLDALQNSYYEFGRQNTVVITRSNKRANLFNQAIRQRILFHEDEIAAGDTLMVVRNNYFWLPEDSKAAFIANGDLLEVQSLRRTDEFYGFRFAEATVKLVDYPDEPTFEVKLLLDTLQSESPSLTFDENNRLFNGVMEDYADIPSRQKRMQAIKTNPYFNALQVKHANALTCHKTQGGQWDVAFVEKGFLKDEMLDTDYMRWLYTAVTRASRKLFLVNFESRFFEQ